MPRSVGAVTNGGRRRRPHGNRGTRLATRHHVVVPVLVVLLRPRLVDVAVAHRLVGPAHADRAEVDVEQRQSPRRASRQSCAPCSRSASSARVWSKLGKFEHEPADDQDQSSRITTITQNNTFSPALNLPAGTCVRPERSSMPPSRRIHGQSYDCGRFSPGEHHDHHRAGHEKIGPTKLCRFLLRIASHANSV